MVAPRIFVEKLVSVNADPQTGLVKIALGVDEGGKVETTVNLVLSAGHLREIFGTVGQTMQKTFSEGGPGRGPRRGPPGEGGPREERPFDQAKFKDITK